jgi:hypothetical protein
MNAGATAERVLKALRLRLMDRDIRPGDRLDPALLTSQLGASATPVREALHVLSGEGLVEARAGGGFCLPLLDEAALQDRYDWSGQLLQIALRHWPRESRDLRANPLAGAGQDPAARCAELSHGSAGIRATASMRAPSPISTPACTVHAWQKRKSSKD